MEKAVYGFNKYLKLNVLKDYSYKALNLHDVEIQKEKINNMFGSMSAMKQISKQMKRNNFKR